LVLLGGRHSSGVVIVVPVDEAEHRRERCAQLDASPAVVAHVEHPRHLIANVRLVEIFRMPRVVGDRHSLVLPGLWWMLRNETRDMVRQSCK